MAPIRQTNRAFGLTFATVFTVVFAVVGLVWGAWLTWPLVVAGLFAIVALAAPGILLPLNRLWGVLAGGLSVANNHLLLGLFFFLIVTPVGITARLFGWDPMARKPSGENSCWTAVGRHTDRDTIRDMF